MDPANTLGFTPTTCCFSSCCFCWDGTLLGLLFTLELLDLLFFVMTFHSILPFGQTKANTAPASPAKAVFVCSAFECPNAIYAATAAAF
jgi:hypothetical protein